MPPLGTLNWTDVGSGIGLGETVDVATGSGVEVGVIEGAAVLLLVGGGVWLGPAFTVGAQLATTMAKAVARANSVKGRVRRSRWPFERRCPGARNSCIGPH